MASHTTKLSHLAQSFKPQNINSSVRSVFVANNNNTGHPNLQAETSKKPKTHPQQSATVEIGDSTLFFSSNAAVNEQQGNTSAKHSKKKSAKKSSSSWSFNSSRLHLPPVTSGEAFIATNYSGNNVDDNENDKKQVIELAYNVPPQYKEHALKLGGKIEKAPDANTVLISKHMQDYYRMVFKIKTSSNSDASGLVDFVLQSGGKMVSARTYSTSAAPDSDKIVEIGDEATVTKEDIVVESGAVSTAEVSKDIASGVAAQGTEANVVELDSQIKSEEPAARPTKSEKVAAAEPEATTSTKAGREVAPTEDEAIPRDKKKTQPTMLEIPAIKRRPRRKSMADARSRLTAEDILKRRSYPPESEQAVPPALRSIARKLDTFSALELNLKKVEANFLDVISTVQNYLNGSELHIAVHEKCLHALDDTKNWTHVYPLVERIKDDVQNSRVAKSTRIYNQLLTQYANRDASEYWYTTEYLLKQSYARLSNAALGVWQQTQPQESTSPSSKPAQDLKTLAFYTALKDLYQALSGGEYYIKRRTREAIIRSAAVNLDKSFVSQIMKTFDLERTMLSSSTYASLIHMNARLGDAAEIKRLLLEFVAERGRLFPVSSPTTTMMTADGVWAAAIEGFFTCNEPGLAIWAVEFLLPELNKGAGFPPKLTVRVCTAIVNGYLSSGDEAGALRWFDRLFMELKATSDDHIKNKQTTSFSQDRLVLDVLNKAVTVEPIPVDLILAAVGHIGDASDADVILALNRVMDALCARFWECYSANETDTALALLATINKYADTYFAHIPDRLLQKLVFVNGVAGNQFRSIEFVNRITERRNYQTVHDIEAWAQKIKITALAGVGYVLDESKSLVPPAPGKYTLKDTLYLLTYIKEVFKAQTLSAPYEIDKAIVHSYITECGVGKGHSTLNRLTNIEWMSLISACGVVASSQKDAGLLNGSTPGQDMHGLVKDLDSCATAGVIQNATFLFSKESSLKDMVRTLLTQAEAVDHDVVLTCFRLFDREAAAAIDAGTTSLESYIAVPVPAKDVSAPKKALTSKDRVMYLATDLPNYYREHSILYAKLPKQLHHSTEIDDVLQRIRIHSDINGGIIGKNEVLNAKDIVTHFTQENPKIAPLHMVYRFIQNKVLRSGLMPSAHVLSGLVSEANRLLDFTTAQELYVLALRSISHDQDTTALRGLETHMIIAASEADNMPLAFDHLDRMTSAKMAPSATAFATMIIHLKETTDDASAALRLYERSRELGVVPSVYLLNTVIAKLSRARRCKEAIALFDEMQNKYKIEPTSVTYGSIINACCKVGDDVGADLYFDAMVNTRGFKPRVPPFNTMIQFYTQVKPDRAKALMYYDRMRSMGVPPTGHTYKLLLDLYGSVQPVDPVSVNNVFAELVANKNVEVTGHHWASLIHSKGIVMGDVDGALAVFEDIKQQSRLFTGGGQDVPGKTSRVKRKVSRPTVTALLPDAIVYESLLNVLVQNQAFAYCDKYITEMDARGIKQTPYICNLRIQAYAGMNDMNRARSVFNGMVDSAAKDLSRSHPAMVGTSETFVSREPSTYETMIRCELQAGCFDEAVHLIDQASQRGYPPAVMSHMRALLSAYTNAEAVPLSFSTPISFLADGATLSYSARV